MTLLLVTPQANRSDTAGDRTVRLLWADKEVRERLRKGHNESNRAYEEVFCPYLSFLNIFI